MSNRRDIQFTYNPHNKATILDCSFTVNSAAGTGLGIQSLAKSGRISSVYMNSADTFTAVSHTSTSLTGIPSTAALSVGMGVSGSGLAVGTTIAAIVSGTAITLSAATSTSTTPTVTYWVHPGANVPAGYMVVNLQDNYNSFLYGKAAFVAPPSGSSVLVASAGVVLGTVYTITILGTTSAAQWQSIGLPANITPALGVSFIATKTGTATGTGAVQVPLAAGAGVFDVEVVGNPSVMNSNGAYVLGAGNGTQLLLACYADSSADAPVIAAPSDLAGVKLLLYFNNSAQGV